MFAEYCEQKELLQALPTYRQSQDHVELLFGAIRAKGGCNNNPNASQFKAIYKKLLLNNDVKCPAKGNCTEFHDTTLGLDSSSKFTGPSKSSDLNTSSHEIHVLNQVPQMSYTDIELIRQDKYITTAIDVCAADIHKRLVEAVKCRGCVEYLILDDMKTMHH